MTVEELIKKLEGYPSDSKVIIEINGLDAYVKEIYEDDKNDVCLFTDGKEIIYKE
jgi:phage repressor protein C with HTH and peptisase S24 domain